MSPVNMILISTHTWPIKTLNPQLVESLFEKTDYSYSTENKPTLWVRMASGAEHRIDDPSVAAHVRSYFLWADVPQYEFQETPR